MRFNSEELKTAYERGGFRERYAMKNGNRATVYIGGAKCYKWTYNNANPYQDANGATYDTTRRAWIA